jgi:CHAD domain-containing protein
VRLLNKRLTYSIESLEDLFSDSSFAKRKSMLKQLRKAQRSLGQLNDDARGQAMAASINRTGFEPCVRFLDRKRKKRLLRSASAAYMKLRKAKPFRRSDLIRSPSADD